MPTLAQWLQNATVALTPTSDSPRIDAEALARHALALGAAQLIAHAERTLDDTDNATLAALLTRRAAGEPIAYLTGEREFWSLPIKVNPYVLIPRPETELLVAQALRFIPTGRGCVVADLGTGSGAIALAIAHERPHAHVMATDISPQALALARENARALNIGNIEFCLSDWCGALREACRVIVSNPPYIRDGDAHLAQGDVRFEPRLALTAGADGLHAIRAIAAQARTCLANGGTLILEHGFDQQAAVIDIIQTQGYRAVEGLRDLAGQPRAVVAQARE